MRVGLLTSSLSEQGGGISVATNALGKALSAAGIEVTLFGRREALSAGPAQTTNRVKILPGRGPPAFGYMSGLEASLREADLDVLHAHGLWMYPSVAARRWSARAQRPYVVSAHGMLEPWALRNSRWKKEVAWHLFERSNLAGAACLHALTSAEVHSIRRLGLTNSIAVIRNGVKSTPMEGYRPRPAWLRDDPRHMLLFLGRIHPKKGLRELISAWARLKARRSALSRTWVLAIAGWDDGGHQRQLELMVETLSLRNEIMFPGPLYGDAKDAAFLHARAFVLPSLSEGLPVAALEAWAYGLPAFLTAACNLPDGFARGAAFEIKTDPAMMADRLADLLGDENALSEAGARGRTLVRDRYSWEKIAAEMAELYSWLIGSGPRPATVE